MNAYLGKFDPAAFTLAKEALEAADIVYAVRQDTPLHHGKIGAKYELFVEEDRVTDAKAAIERWQQEVQQAVMRECDAPIPRPEELAADAEWERQRQAEANRPSLLVPCLIALALIIVAAAVVGLYSQSHGR